MQICTDLRDGFQNQADQPFDMEMGRGWVQSHLFLMNPRSFQNRQQRRPSAGLVFAHGQQDRVQGLPELQLLESRALCQAFRELLLLSLAPCSCVVGTHGNECPCDH